MCKVFGLSLTWFAFIIAHFDSISCVCVPFSTGRWSYMQTALLSLLPVFRYTYSWPLFHRVIGMDRKGAHICSSQVRDITTYKPMNWCDARFKQRNSAKIPYEWCRFPWDRFIFKSNTMLWSRPTPFIIFELNLRNWRREEHHCKNGMYTLRYLCVEGHRENHRKFHTSLSILLTKFWYFSLQI